MSDILERLCGYQDIADMDERCQSDFADAAREIQRLRGLCNAYRQEVECWRKGDGMGEFIYAMRDVDNAGKPGWSDEALWSWEIVGAKQFTDETVEGQP